MFKSTPTNMRLCLILLFCVNIFPSKFTKLFIWKFDFYYSLAFSKILDNLDISADVDVWFWGFWGRKWALSLFCLEICTMHRYKEKISLLMWKSMDSKWINGFLKCNIIFTLQRLVQIHLKSDLSRLHIFFLILWRDLNHLEWF